MFDRVLNTLLQFIMQQALDAYQLKGRLYGKFQLGLKFQNDKNFSPPIHRQAGIFSPAKKAAISHVIDFKFQPSLKNCLLGKKIRIKTKFKMAEKSQSPRAEGSFEKNLKPRFRWHKEERINNLIQCTLSY